MVEPTVPQVLEILSDSGGVILIECGVKIAIESLTTLLFTVVPVPTGLAGGAGNVLRAAE